MNTLFILLIFFAVMAGASRETPNRYPENWFQDRVMFQSEAHRQEIDFKLKEMLEDDN